MKSKVKKCIDETLDLAKWYQENVNTIPEALKSDTIERLVYNLSILKGHIYNSLEERK